MATRLPAALHVRAPKVLFGCYRIVGLAPEANVLKLVLATESKRTRVMNFEAMRFSAAHAAFIDIRAASLVAFIDSAATSCRNVATALSSFSRYYGRRRLTLRCETFFRTKTPFLERLHQKSHRLQVQFPKLTLPALCENNARARSTSSACSAVVVNCIE